MGRSIDPNNEIVVTCGSIEAMMAAMMTVTNPGDKVHDFLTAGATAPLQEAVIPGLKFGQDYYDDLLAKYTHKKELFLKGLDDLQIEHNDPAFSASR